GDQVAILRIGRRPRGNSQFLAEHLLVDRFETPAAVLNLTENSKHAMLRMIDDPDDAATVTNSVFFLGFVDAQQHAIAKAGRFTRSGLARDVDADFRCRPVRVLVPLVWSGNEIAVAIARGDVREYGRGQGARVVQFLAAFFD